MTSMQDVLPLIPSDEWIPGSALSGKLGAGVYGAIGGLIAKGLVVRREVTRDSLPCLFEYRATRERA